MATGTPVTREEAENLRVQHGQHQFLYAQYARRVWRMLRGNFGVSMEWQQPVKEGTGDLLFLRTFGKANARLKPQRPAGFKDDQEQQ